MRCSWCNINNDAYIYYHDHEWGRLNLNDEYLYEMFILESFQAGLSWECVLNKRNAFRVAYDNFSLDKVINYKEEKINELLSNKDIIRNRLKIKASINNSKILKNIILEYSSLKDYLLSFFKVYPIYEVGKTTSWISDEISKNLKKRGMKFVGSVTIYSYLQAVGLINSHEKNCFLYKK